jgi:hypothetical protein
MESDRANAQRAAEMARKPRSNTGLICRNPHRVLPYMGINRFDFLVSANRLIEGSTFSDGVHLRPRSNRAHVVGQEQQNRRDVEQATPAL